MIEINKNLSNRQLRLFAGLWFPLFLALAGFMIYRHTGPDPAKILWGAGGVLALLALLSLTFARYLYLGMIYLTYPIGWVVSHVILLSLYYLILSPIGILLRALGRDPLRKTPDPTAKTYWLEREPASESSRYFRQY